MWRLCKKEAGGGGEGDRRVVSQARSVKPRCLNLSSVFFYTVQCIFPFEDALQMGGKHEAPGKRGSEKKSQGKTLNNYLDSCS